MEKGWCLDVGCFAGKMCIRDRSRQGLFFIPLVIVLSSRIGFLGVQMSQPISDVLSFLVAIILQASVLREMNLQVKKEEAE